MSSFASNAVASVSSGQLETKQYLLAIDVPVVLFGIRSALHLVFFLQQLVEPRTYLLLNEYSKIRNDTLGVVSCWEATTISLNFACNFGSLSSTFEIVLPWVKTKAENRWPVVEWRGRDGLAADR